MTKNSAKVFDRNWEDYEDWFEGHKSIYPSGNMLKLGKEHGIQVIQGAGENLPFKDNTFDSISESK